MGFGRRSRRTPTDQLIAAAGLRGRIGLAGGEGGGTGDIAFLAMRPPSIAVQPTLVAVERLLADETAYDVVLGFIEEIQNVTSHSLDMFLRPDEVMSMLGPRGVVCWQTLLEFWSLVADWCAENGPPLESSTEILSVENDQLRALLWTSNRTQPDGAKLGLAQAVRYEMATGAGVPGFSHIEMALRMSE